MEIKGFAASLIYMCSVTKYSRAISQVNVLQFQSLMVQSSLEHVRIKGLQTATSIEDIQPEWNPSHTRSNFISYSRTSFSPIDFVKILPMLLFSRDIAMQSSLGEQSRLRILIPFVAPGYHFLIPSYAVFPEVALFSSDLTQRAMYPLSDATKKPLE